MTALPVSAERAPEGVDEESPQGERRRRMRICIIGAAGHWNYVLQELDRHSLVGIAPGYPGEDMGALRECLMEKGMEVRYVEDFKRLLCDAQIAVVCSRFDLNAGITAVCLERGISVFAEKPLAVNLCQLEELEKVWRKSGVCVAAMFGLRFTSWFLTLKAAVSEIGPIRLINAQKSYKLGVRPAFFGRQDIFGGLIPWVAIHAMDWIYALTDAEFCKVQALSSREYNGGNGDLEVAALCQFEMEGGILASVSADYFRPEQAPTHDDDRIRVVGAKGIAEYAGGRVRLTGPGGYTEPVLQASQDVFELFVRRVNGEKTGIGAEESFYLTRVALQARDCALGGGGGQRIM